MVPPLACTGWRMHISFMSLTVCCCDSDRVDLRQHSFASLTGSCAHAAQRSPCVWNPTSCTIFDVKSNRTGPDPHNRVKVTVKPICYPKLHMVRSPSRHIEVCRFQQSRQAIEFCRLPGRCQVRIQDRVYPVIRNVVCAALRIHSQYRDWVGCVGQHSNIDVRPSRVPYEETKDVIVLLRCIWGVNCTGRQQGQRPAFSQSGVNVTAARALVAGQVARLVEGRLFEEHAVQWHPPSSEPNTY